MNKKFFCLPFPPPLLHIPVSGREKELVTQEERKRKVVGGEKISENLPLAEKGEGREERTFCLGGRKEEVEGKGKKNLCLKFASGVLVPSPFWIKGEIYQYEGGGKYLKIPFYTHTPKRKSFSDFWNAASVEITTAAAAARRRFQLRPPSLPLPSLLRSAHTPGG